MNLLYANDRPGAYPDSYYAASAPPAPVSAALETELTADVVIVGAGYTGLSAALHLAEAGRDVVLLDAHRIGWGASGRNGGQVGSGQRVDQPELEKMLGERRARQLWDLGEDAKKLVKRLIKTHEIDCDMRPGILYTDHKDSGTDGMRAYAEHMNTVYDYPITFLDRVGVHGELGTRAYASGILDKRAAHLHPLKYAQGLGRIARAAGVRVFENSPVTQIEPGRVQTNRGSVRARNVLLAANGYLGQLAPSVARHVMPINNYIVATEPLGKERAQSLIRRNVAVADSKFVVNYFRLSADHRLLFGGGESYSYRFPRDIAAKARTPMLEIYPQLRDVRIDYAWGGTLGITMSRLPYLTDLGDGILSASGYSGHGVAIATLSGALMAEALTGDRSRFEAMAAIPAQPFPGPARWRTPLLMLAMSWYALRDRF
ncbi:NAD(P)/FAD-dependent oxidoreductase [Pontivivens insulae]|uniref:Gamma-glutamylputrescine oxidoreductase n=1 Tax=Pontivivens insulae TaxID=1639689 RepID=A0A2R8A7V7_9RHOB|nr:FAD-binding oxidoreductase [Pontivivens insulae]RED18220.1 gamma-glutamylputrescine oxidase [Pontivivens insulae]SPF28118.1 Gamma-glutamylputrescine oxidoreductase [Pontivivens insulae]